jgi:hypothetical protein
VALEQVPTIALWAAFKALFVSVTARGALRIKGCDARVGTRVSVCVPDEFALKALLTLM